MTTSEKLSAIAENEQKVYDAGKKSQYDKFWDEYQQNGNRKSYNYAFSGAGWNDKTYNPKYPIAPVGDVSFMYAYNKIKKIGDIDMSKATGNLNQTFRQNAELTEIGEIILNNSITALSTTFYSNMELVTIKKIKFGTIKTFTNTFTSNPRLKNIILEGTIAGNINFGNSKLLSKESIMSIINALSESTSGLTVTFSTDAVNLAFGIDVNDVTTYPEGSEYYILRNKKANWTFNYV